MWQVDGKFLLSLTDCNIQSHMVTRGTYWGFEADAHIRELKEFSYRYVSGDILYIWEALNQSDIYQKQHILHIGAYQKTYDTDIYQLTNSVR